MPMLDYVIFRSYPGDKVDDEYENMEPKDIFVAAVNKLLKMKRYHRKKQFKFADLLKFMKEHQMSEEQQQSEKAREMIAAIVPQLKVKIEKILTESVDKLLATVENQDMKIFAIKEVLQEIKDARHSVNGGEAAQDNQTEIVQ